MAKKDNNETLKNSVTNIVLDQDGFAVGVKGKLKASDFHSRNVTLPSVKNCGSQRIDFCAELQIKRLD